MHEWKGRRFNRYHELGVYAMGPIWGQFIIIVPQLIVMVGVRPMSGSEWASDGRAMQLSFVHRC